MIAANPKPARHGWDEAFARLARTEEPLLPDHMSEEWDEAEWTWES